MSHRPQVLWVSYAILAVLPAHALAHRALRHRLIVVADQGGVSALPYYRAIHLLPARNDPRHAIGISPPPLPRRPYSERDFLPVVSSHLAPGRVRGRVISAPGLTPLCLVGDDARSRAWLKKRVATLQALHAACLVVNIATYAELQELRRLAPHVPLVPASGDDIARRLKLHHYPVLITATGIEQ